MNKFLKISMVALLLAGFAIGLNSCKKDFDSPPGPSDPAIVANTTIADLKAIHQTASAYDIITSDLIIEGIVVANDRSGNLYKQIFIEDAKPAVYKLHWMLPTCLTLILLAEKFLSVVKIFASAIIMVHHNWV